MNIATEIALKVENGSLYSNRVEVQLYNESGLSRILPETEARDLINLILPDQFKLNRLGGLLNWEIVPNKEVFSSPEHNTTIQLPQPASGFNPSDFPPLSDIRSTLQAGLVNYIVILGPRIINRGLVTCESPDDWFLTLFEGRFIPADDAGDSSIGCSIVIERASKFYDLSKLKYNYLGTEYLITEDALVELWMEDHSVVFTDLLDGSNTEEGLIIENQTITSIRLIKKAYIYYEYNIS